MKTMREAFGWLPVKIAAVALAELVIISLVMDIWSVVVR